MNLRVTYEYLLICRKLDFVTLHRGWIDCVVKPLFGPHGFKDGRLVGGLAEFCDLSLIVFRYYPCNSVKMLWKD